VLIGAAFQALAAIFETLALGWAVIFPPYNEVSPYRFYGMMPSHFYPYIGFLFPLVMWFILAWSFVVIAFLAAVLIRRNPETGGVIALVIAVLSMPTIWGFFVGSLLMFIGSILALVWRPQPQSAQSTSRTAP